MIEYTPRDVVEALSAVLALVETAKSQAGRSPEGRVYAIIATDLEKATALAKVAFPGWRELQA